MNNFRRPTTQEALILQQNFDFIYRIANFYQTYLSNKDIFIYTQNEEVCLRVLPNAIFHLLGLKHVQNNKQFWSDLKNRRLKSDNLLIQNFTFRKLQVMHEFPNIFLGRSYLTEGFELKVARFAKALRSNRLILAVGLEQQNNYYFPKSAIDIRRNTTYQNFGNEILEIYTMDRGTGKREKMK